MRNEEFVRVTCLKVRSVDSGLTNGQVRLHHVLDTSDDWENESVEVVYHHHVEGMRLGTVIAKCDSYETADAIFDLCIADPALGLQVIKTFFDTERAKPKWVKNKSNSTR